MTSSRRTFVKFGFGSGAVTLQHAALQQNAPQQVRPEAGKDLTALTIQEAAELVRKKTISPVDLTKACLLRIERLNPSLNAFITIASDAALAEARAAETEVRSGRWRGSLHGIPIALKDNIDTAGLRTTAASALFADRIPTQDAEVAKRLKAAGTVLLGKLNMHEFAYGGSSVASHFGPVHNPWNSAHIAGGSSGGSSCALAARLCYGALGTDTGGSIRMPAAYCGIVGLKATYARISIRGIIPVSWSFDHVGPMARSVADIALLLQAMAGYDPEDPTSADRSVADYSAAFRMDTTRFKLGIPRRPFYEALDPEIESATSEALAVLRRLTKSVQDVELPSIPSSSILSAEAYTYHAAYVTKTPHLYQSETLERLKKGPEVSASSYITARRQLELARRAASSIFMEVDLLVTPTTAIPPPTIEESRKTSLPLPIRNTGRFNSFGLPAISVPCGFTTSGLPIGLQIIGPHWAEANVLALANSYQQATAWHTRTPL